jgi:hypothetical protein
MYVTTYPLLPVIADLTIRKREQVDNTGRLDSTGPNTVTDTLQQNMARITVLKANILRTVACFNTLTPMTLTRMSNDLERWYSNLPGYMRLQSLVKHPEITPEQRRVTLYIHLFYFSAILLKARAVLANKDLPTYLEKPEVHAAIVDGVGAARTSGRILTLIYKEKGIIKNCWLTM